MSDALENWDALNKALKKMSGKKGEDEAWALLKREQTGGKRTQFLLRIFGRANKLRGDRERKEILR